MLCAAALSAELLALLASRGVFGSRAQAAMRPLQHRGGVLYIQWTAEAMDWQDDLTAVKKADFVTPLPPATATAIEPPPPWLLKIDAQDRPGLGKSQASLHFQADAEANRLVFAGVLGRVSANDGISNAVGFCQARAVIKSLPADTKVVRFRARDPVPRLSPNVYSFLLCVNAADVHNYQADFMLPDTEWHEVTIAIKALRPNRRGRTVLDAGLLSPAKARGVGLTILRSRQRTPSVSGSGLPFCIELADGAFEFWG